METQTTAAAGLAMAAFNLAAFEATDTAWLELQNKKGDGPLLFNGLPVRAQIRSPGTREALNAQHLVEQAASARTFAAMRGKPAKETVDGKLEERAAKLAAVTVQFDNFPVPPAEVYKNPKMGWFTNQIAEFHVDWANF